MLCRKYTLISIVAFCSLTACVTEKNQHPNNVKVEYQYPDGLKVGAFVGELFMEVVDMWDGKISMGNPYVDWRVDKLRGKWIKLDNDEKNIYIWVNIDNVLTCWFKESPSAKESSK